jgi:hypothetical protein
MSILNLDDGAARSASIFTARATSIIRHSLRNLNKKMEQK